MNLSARRLDAATLIGENLELKDFTAKAFRQIITYDADCSLDFLIDILRTGVNLNAIDENGDTMMMSAVRSAKDLDVLGLLYAFGSDVNMVDDEGMNAFLLACMISNDLRIPSLLLQMGGDCLIVNSKGESALDLARKNPALRGGPMIILIEQEIARRTN